MVGVSTDSQERNDEFRASLELPFPLVGDPEGAIVKAYGVRVPLVGVARRVTFLVGRDRKVEAVHASMMDAGSHVETACKLVLKK